MDTLLLTSLSTDIEEYLPVVRQAALWIRTNTGTAVEFDDLVQVGLVGLLEAAKRFDPERGTSFKVFAGARVFGAMRDEARRWDGVSRTSMRRAPRPLSLNVTWDDDDQLFIVPHDQAPTADVAAELRDDVRALLRTLPRIPRTVLRLHLMDDLTLKAIGDRLGLSESRICQIYRHALSTLRRRSRDD